MIVLGCGDRNWKDPRPIRFVLETLFRQFRTPFTVIEGQCPYGGADKLIAEWATQRKKAGVVHVPMPADWVQLGKSAGPRRNRQMLERLLTDDDPDKMVVAFHPNLMMSKGTLDMVTLAEGVPGLPVWLFDGAGGAADRTNRQQQIW